MKSFPCRMRRVLAASAFQYSWSIWEATCVRPPHGHRYATGKFGSKARWLRFWVASWIWCTVLGTCRTIVASWWTRTQLPTSSPMKSSARHGETFQAYCNMGTDNLKRYVVVAASQTYLPVCRTMVAFNDKEDEDYNDCDVGLVWGWPILYILCILVYTCA